MEKIPDSKGYENSAGVASLRGQGTPAYPARLRSERARNSSKMSPCRRGRKVFKNFYERRAVKALEVRPADFLPPQNLGRPWTRKRGTSLPGTLYLSSSPRR